MFNGTVSADAARQHDQALLLSGWVCEVQGTAVRPIQMRLRAFGRDRQGAGVFLGDVLQVTAIGKPGRWVQFRASGTVPAGDLTGMDLHCSISPDMVRTVQYLDDLRIEPVVPPPLQVRPVHSVVWRDQGILGVEVRVNRAERASARLTLSLVATNGKTVARRRASSKTSLVGVPLPKAKLREGRYVLRAELRARTGPVVASAQDAVMLTASPWEGAPSRPRASGRRILAGQPAAFSVMGTVAPTDAFDALPSQPEMIGLDPDLPSSQKRGYAVFARHYLDPPQALSRPRLGETASLRIFASRGEYEPAAVSVWAVRPLKGVRVTVSNLAGNDAVIAASNVDVRVVRTIPNLPPFLEKREPVDIPEGRTRTFWLTIYVPPETPAGFYYGDVIVAPEDRRRTQLPLLLRVSPVKLPAPPKGYGFWWKMDGRWNGYYSKEPGTALEQIRKQFILLREHGCNMVSCYGMPRMAKAGGAFTFDFGQDHWAHDKFSLADFFRLGRETGFLVPRVPIQYAGAESLHSDWIARLVGVDRLSPAFARFYKDACREIDRWARKQGFTLAFACVDEIGNAPQRRQEALRFYRIAKEAGVLTSVTDNSMHGGVHLMGQPRFDDIIDMRLYNFVVPEMIQHARRSGDRLWLYNLGSTGWDPKRDRFVFGLFTERCGADGYSQWAFQWPSGGANPYEAAVAGQSTGWHYARRRRMVPCPP
ncbi:MAG: glycoside hydrolase domain-containing protein [Armatimonadota bacterium]